MSDEMNNFGSVPKDNEKVAERKAAMQPKGGRKEMMGADGLLSERQSHDIKKAFLKEILKSNDPHRALNRTSRLNINRSNIPDGVEAKWIRLSIKGVPDSSNLAKSASDHYRFAPIEFHPERLNKDMFGKVRVDNNMIIEGDLGYAYRAKEIGNEYRASYKRKTYELTNNIPIKDGFVTQSGHRTNMHFSQKKLSDIMQPAPVAPSVSQWG